MFNNKKFLELKKEIYEFNNLLENFVITSSQLNSNEDLINLNFYYENNLRDITRTLLVCEKKEKIYEVCLNEYKENFYKLRSDLSINLEKQIKKI